MKEPWVSRSLKCGFWQMKQSGIEKMGVREASRAKTLMCMWESPGDCGSVQILTQKIWKWAYDSAFLTTSQVMFMLQVWGPLFGDVRVLMTAVLK